MSDILKYRVAACKIFRLITMTGTDDCWLWQGEYDTAKQSPKWSFKGKRVVPYRVVYELTTGNPIPPGMVIRHSCDNRRCCNPRHLSIGTQQDNMDDMKLRARHGLTHHAIKGIKKLLASGIAQQQIADLYGVSRECVRDINTGRTAKHVEE